MMRRVLYNTQKTKEYLETLPKIYLVACWARYGVREYYFSGTYAADDDGLSIPMVYNYYDGNGTCDEYRLMPITHTTSGNILLWTQSKPIAEKTVKLWNAEKGW